VRESSVKKLQIGQPKLLQHVKLRDDTSRKPKTAGKKDSRQSLELVRRQTVRQKKDEQPRKGGGSRRPRRRLYDKNKRKRDNSSTRSQGPETG
jgi:hypothetical protein